MRDLGTASSVFGVLGDPALGSLGPWIHNRALRAAGVDGVYLPLETKRPLEVLDMLPRRRVRGVSVTAPHKVQLYGACQRVTPEADAVGAINTLTWDTHGAVLGHNTDVAGVALALERAGVGSGEGRRGVVLGGGGAARAAAVALAQMGFGVTILARSLDKVREFSKAHGYRLGALRRDVLDSLAPSVVGADGLAGMQWRHHGAEAVRFERAAEEAALRVAPRGSRIMGWIRLSTAAEVKVDVVEDR